MMLLELFNPVFDKEVFHIELPLLQYFLQKYVRDVHLSLSLVGCGIAFKDVGFKSFCVIVLLIEVRDEFLLPYTLSLRVLIFIKKGSQFFLHFFYTWQSRF